jgi:hypothetical protein
VEDSYGRYYNAIVGALAGISKDTIKDSYDALKALLKKKLAKKAIWLRQSPSWKKRPFRRSKSYGTRRS